MIEPVAAMPQIRLRAVPVLPDELEHAPGRADAEHVQQHRLQRQQQRAERAREQHERDDRDQREHQREVAVDGVDEVVVLRRRCRRRARPAPASCAAARTRSSVARPAEVEPSADRERVDDRGAAVAPCGAGRRDRAVDAVHAAPARARPARRRRPRRRAPRSASARPAPMPERSSATRPCLRVAVLARACSTLAARAGGWSRRAASAARTSAGAGAATQRRRTTSCAHRVHERLALVVAAHVRPVEPRRRAWRARPAAA